MLTLNNTKIAIAATATAFLTACGGGGAGGGGSSTALFQYIQANTFSGYTYVGRGINDNDLTSSGTSGCGVVTSPIPDQATVEARVTSLGGSVITSTPTKWCGTASGQTGCFIQADKFFVIDNRTAQTDVEIDMPGLVADRMTVVKYNSQYLPALIQSTTRDSTRTSTSNCPAMVSQPANAIDGNWSGYKATYDTNTKTAVSTTASVSCTNQACTLSDASTTSIALSQLYNGTWSTSANAPKYAGASVTDDRQLLSMFVCSAPLIESQALASCSFYTFKR